MKVGAVCDDFVFWYFWLFALHLTYTLLSSIWSDNYSQNAFSVTSLGLKSDWSSFLLILVLLVDCHSLIYILGFFYTSLHLIFHLIWMHKLEPPFYKYIIKLNLHASGPPACIWTSTLIGGYLLELCLTFTSPGGSASFCCME